MTCWQLIKSDLYRYYGTISLRKLLHGYLLVPGFRFMFWFRIASAVRANKILGTLTFFILRHYSYLFGFDITRGTDIGKGFYIGHFGGVVISGAAKIGDNCNISQGVTIGVSGVGENRGVPIIGDNVYIGAGAKVIGKIVIGNNVAIGANAVVTRDVPDNTIVAGVPAKVIGENTYTHIILNPYNE